MAEGRNVSLHYHLTDTDLLIIAADMGCEQVSDLTEDQISTWIRDTIDTEFDSREIEYHALDEEEQEDA